MQGDREAGGRQTSVSEEAGGSPNNPEEMVLPSRCHGLSSDQGAHRYRRPARWRALKDCEPGRLWNMNEVTPEGTHQTFIDVIGLPYQLSEVPSGPV